MTLDTGGTDRITPTELVMAWAPDADPKKIDEQFEKWEQWAAGILETHSTVPLLVLFRSHDRRQNWVTALGLLCDAALHAQIINGATDGYAYWFLRRAEAIFMEVTQGHDLHALPAAANRHRHLRPLPRSLPAPHRPRLRPPTLRGRPSLRPPGAGHVRPGHGVPDRRPALPPGILAARLDGAELVEPIRDRPLRQLSRQLRGVHLILMATLEPSKRP